MTADTSGRTIANIVTVTVLIMDTMIFIIVFIIRSIVGIILTVGRKVATVITGKMGRRMVVVVATSMRSTIVGRRRRAV